MNNSDFENADGGVIDYEAVIACNNIGARRENFMDASGGDDDFFDADGEDDDFFNAGGRAKRQKRRDLRTKSKAEVRVKKADAKVGLSQAQIEAAKAAKEGVKADIATATALTQPASPKPVKTGMSTGLKVGIGLGVAALIAGIVYMVKRGKKGK